MAEVAKLRYVCRVKRYAWTSSWPRWRASVCSLLCLQTPSLTVEASQGVLSSRLRSEGIFPRPQKPQAKDLESGSSQIASWLLQGPAEGLQASCVLAHQIAEAAMLSRMVAHKAVDRGSVWGGWGAGSAVPGTSDRHCLPAGPSPSCAGVQGASLRQALQESKARGRKVPLHRTVLTRLLSWNINIFPGAAKLL